MKKQLSKVKFSLIGIAVILMGFAIYVICYLNTASPADAEAVAAMASTIEVEVKETQDIITFLPADSTPSTGLIYYPGGQVEPQSFAYAAREIAKSGVLVIIQKMPYNLAILGKDKAYALTSQFKDIQDWYISGFSLGGISACMSLSKQPTPFKGLILYASYTTKDYNLLNSGLKVLSISGSSDGLSTQEKISLGKQYLPADAQYYEIEGGNHTQFAIYGGGKLQKGDNAAAIDRMKQQEIIVEKTVEFMAANK